VTGTRLSKFLLITFCVVTSSSRPVWAQRNLAGTAEIQQSLGRLKVLGSVLMIAAHPDDENTAALAYFARGLNLETGYLSLTRGEGGQNFIGSEQGAKLGIIRTQELLAARRTDGAQQFFSRAIDFGFTKTADETMAKWGRERVLGDIVWTIRRFRPDVIILRFSGTPRDGHGQHQTSAILGKEAFSAAADPKRFPEQLSQVEPWQTKRLMWNVFAFTPEQEKEANAMGGKVGVDTGAYNPVLGYSYGEIAGMSRSMHRSQAMGSPERKGKMDQFFVTIAGDTARTGIFEGIDITWSRVAGSGRIAELVAEAEGALTPAHPEKAIPALIEARQLVAALKNPWAARKLPEFDEAIGLCAGVWVDVSAERATATPGSQLKISVTAVNRGSADVMLQNIDWEGTAPSKPEALAVGQKLSNNVPLTRPVAWSISADQPYTQPYWLGKPQTGESYSIPDERLVGRPENPPALEARFVLQIAGVDVPLLRPVQNRFVDRARGELVQPLAIVPPVSIAMPEHALFFANGAGKRIEVPVRSEGGPVSGSITLTAAKGWRIDPPAAEFQLGAGEQRVLGFTVVPPASGDAVTDIQAIATVNGRKVGSEVDVIDYEHIPAQTLFPEARSKAVSAQVRTLSTKIGYIMGAGDEVPESLRQMGCDVTLLSPGDVARADLSRFDAIVTGVRAWNVRSDVRVNRQRLLDYMQNGGTLVIQYNVMEGGFGGGDPKLLDGIGPYPIRVSRDRVTVEEAPVHFPDPSNLLLKKPNQISDADFQGWVQERGLYFASSWDAHYQALFECHDPGDKPMEGGTLVTKYGKGAYVFTAYAWFRQLPAGVPGAYRIFANFLSAGKVLADAR
jgi:LmbE family N-acetylglucosaminyl deacetylase